MLHRLCLAYQHIEWFEPPIDLAGEGDAPLERVYRCQLDGYPFRQLPRYVDGDVDIVGSMAILRHLGRKHGVLLGACISMLHCLAMLPCVGGV